MPSRLQEGRKADAGRFVSGIGDRFDLELLAAGELLLSGFRLDGLERLRYPGTGWVLVEFSTGVTWMETLIRLRLVLRRGFRPLLAHPERYRWCAGKPERLIELSRMGCGSLASARSLRKPEYASFMRDLLAAGLYHAVSSDVHSLSDHVLDSGTRERLAIQEGGMYWEALTGENPARVLEDLALPALPLKGCAAS